MKKKIKFKRLSPGRYEALVNGEYKATIFNPHKDDTDYPNRWFIRQDGDSEGYDTLKEAKEAFSNKDL